MWCGAWYRSAPPAHRWLIVEQTDQWSAHLPQPSVPPSVGRDAPGPPLSCRATHFLTLAKVGSLGQRKRGTMFYFLIMLLLTPRWDPWIFDLCSWSRC